MMTSADAGDGKTTVASALAAAFAESGESVILIDFDLRQPSIARLLDIRQKPGMESIDRPLEELLVEVPDLPGVRVLPAIHSDASHLAMVIAHLPKVLDEAEALADRIVVDTAPVGFASETLQIAKICDQVVIAVRQEQTDRHRLIATRDLLARSGVPVVGLVATYTTVKPDTTYGYGYGYGYGLDGETHEAARTPGGSSPPSRHAEAKLSRAGTTSVEGADLYR
jgi:Mrp family chromosome partitioning ATPase